MTRHPYPPAPTHTHTHTHTHPRSLTHTHTPPTHRQIERGSGGDMSTQTNLYIRGVNQEREMHCEDSSSIWATKRPLIFIRSITLNHPGLTLQRRMVHRVSWLSHTHSERRSRDGGAREVVSIHHHTESERETKMSAYARTRSENGRHAMHRYIPHLPSAPAVQSVLPPPDHMEEEREGEGEEEGREEGRRGTCTENPTYARDW